MHLPSLPNSVGDEGGAQPRVFKPQEAGLKTRTAQIFRYTTVIHPYHEILLSNKKVTSNKHGNNMDESQKYWAEIKKPDINAYILYDSIYMKLQNRCN